MNDTSSLSLFVLFIQGFKVSDIYALGWYAAAEWMVLVSGVLVALAIAIRSAEEHVNLLANGETRWTKMLTNVFLIAFAIGLYFTIASFIIDLFNAIYSLLSTSPAVEMANDLDATLDKLLAKEHDFNWSEIGDAFFSAFAFVLYWMTHMALVLTTIAMRIAHAVLVSFCLFWGAVALPMSITTGLKMLGAFKNLCILALIWPIVENFFMYLVGGSFSNMLHGSGMDVDGFDTWTMGSLVFYLTAYSVINILLIATLVSAPFVAQGVANNSGNVSGMIGSFAAAGIAAGVLATKALTKPLMAGGKKGLSQYMASRAGGKGGTDLLSPFKSGKGGGPSDRRGVYQGNSSESKTQEPTPSHSSSGSTTEAVSSSSQSSPKDKPAASSTKKSVVSQADTTTPKPDKNKAGVVTTAAAQAVTGSPELVNQNTQEQQSGSVNDIASTEAKKKKRQSQRAGYFANKARQSPKPT